jgi:hypothetical protein
MFRCDNCGSGYSAQAASSLSACPRCQAKEKIQVPLTFELGWKRPVDGSTAVLPPETRGSQAVEIT